MTLWTIGRGGGPMPEARPREVASAPPANVRRPPACAALAEAIVEVGTGRTTAAASVARVDSILLYGPPVGLLRQYSGIALAHLYTELGDRRKALAAIGRRPHAQEWPHYLAPQLREEGRLAAALGDTTAAVRAFRHYLVLREAAEPPAAGDADAIRLELQRLEPGPR